MFKLIRTRNLIAGTAAAALGALALAGSAGAATVNVNSTADGPTVNDGQCTIREAVASTVANNNVGGCGSQGSYALADTIDIPTGTYLLQSPIELEDILTFRGTGPGVVIDQAANNRLFFSDLVNSDASTFENLTLQGGTASNGGLINTNSSLTIRNSTLRGGVAADEGGAVATIMSANESVTIENSTITGNSAAEYGGGLALEGGDVTIRNSTITDNVADTDGDPEADNGGGIVVSVADTYTVANSIIAGNRVEGNGQRANCAGLIEFNEGVNVFGTQGPDECDADANDKVVADAGLAPLADNGGFTPTHALLDGSPARDAGVACLPTDQRGVERGLGGTCDAGSYERVDCEGRAANRIGTQGADTLVGTEGPDVFFAIGGDDTINTGGGDDLVCGGDGNDTLNGDAGNDRMLGEGGDDTLNGADGDDTAVGGAGNDTVSASAGNDTSEGGAGNDTVGGGAGNDRVSGDEGDDRVSGDEGNDDASGGDGNDSLGGGAGNDKLAGQAGKDKLNGGAGKDNLNGGQGKDKLKGAGGKDKCIGSGGKDKGSSCEKERSIP